ncbi:hypothetical protein CA54_53810 [Symmachiella macrocystis]|uniref:Ice-binding protein C-terminal domain-containing protein n=1 Tax=Symmachiella macrocystis TaxID=2527985 RepID=A0A5C6B5E9_9PLAN|nr:PEP-CTERM sorting domain-containing protein [Symmachiella macrocystis]TWU06977.1 hypothetical protein CA54_53810 [Symmachiella macrocystis]
MKRLLLAGLLSFGLLSTAQAETVRPYDSFGDLGSNFYTITPGVTTISLGDGTGPNPGGEFTVDKINGDATYNPYWSGFCVEYSEHFAYNENMEVYGISDYADDGGPPANSVDYLSDETRWLFAQFWTKDLFGVNGSGTTQLDGYYDNQANNAKYLQQAIWMLEDEITVNDQNWYYKSAKAAVLAGTAEGVARFDDVKVLNLYRQNLDSQGNPVKAQDQLVVIGDGLGESPEVPEPSSFAGLIGIFSVSLLGYGWRRKQQQVA